MAVQSLYYIEPEAIGEVLLNLSTYTATPLLIASLHTFNKSRGSMYRHKDGSAEVNYTLNASTVSMYANGNDSPY